MREVFFLLLSHDDRVKKRSEGTLSVESWRVLRHLTHTKSAQKRKNYVSGIFVM